MTSPARALRLGTRGSALARIQAAQVADALRARGVHVELVPVVTSGDVRPPDTMWGEGAFVDALTKALERDEIDLAVHSAKDIPIERAAGTEIAAFVVRVDPRDALVLPEAWFGVRSTALGSTAAGSTAAGLTAIDESPGWILDPEANEPLAELPRGATVGTDSPRRTGFLLAARPNLRIVPLHGNVDTRLRRLDEGAVDALVLAVAGLARLGRSDRIAVVLAPELVPPAPGQGALAVEVRRGDDLVRELVTQIDDRPIRLAVEAERAVLTATGGGCRAPVGALATVDDGQVDLLAGAVDPDGRGFRLVRRRGPLAAAVRLGSAAGRALVHGIAR